MEGESAIKANSGKLSEIKNEYPTTPKTLKTAATLIALRVAARQARRLYFNPAPHAESGNRNPGSEKNPKARMFSRPCCSQRNFSFLDSIRFSTFRFRAASGLRQFGFRLSGGWLIFEIDLSARFDPWFSH